MVTFGIVFLRAEEILPRLDVPITVTLGCLGRVGLADMSGGGAVVGGGRGGPGGLVGCGCIAGALVTVL